MTPPVGTDESTGLLARQDRLIYPVLAAMLALAAILFWWSWRSEERVLRETLQQEVAAAALRLDAEVSRYLMVLTAVEGLFAGSTEVDFREFSLLGQAIHRDLPHLYGFGWYQRVPLAARPAFEARMGALGQPGYFIADSGGPEGLRPAAPRDFYVVVAYAHFAGAPLKTLGFDIYADPLTRRSMLNQADASGHATLSARISLVNDADPGYDLLAVLPVRGSTLVPGDYGYAGMSLHVSTLMKIALAGIPSDITVQLRDLSAPPTESLLYGPDQGLSALRVTAQLQPGSRHWQMEWSLDEAAISARRSWQPWWMLAAALTITLLLDGLLRLLLGRTAHVRELVRRRTADLAKREADLRQALENLTESEARLRKTAEDLADSNRELEQFAYVSSHDLQTPLRGIVGFSQLLHRRYAHKLEPEALEFLTYIEQGCRRMSMLVRDLLEFSRVGRVPKPFTLRPLAESIGVARQALEVAIRESGAVITAEGLPEVWADHGQLAQLFQNLIGNAIKFQPKGQTPRVSVEAVAEEGFWVITVTDNGIGIEDIHLDGIFSVFRRLHTEDEFEGTGIGLSICRKIAVHHGGKIAALPRHRGARFELRLPIEPRYPG